MQVGDCVNLRTGGCLMTVILVCGEAIGCMWFDDSAQLHKEAFWQDELQNWRKA